MATKITPLQFNGKEIRVMSTKTFSNKYGGMELVAYTGIAMRILKEHPVDMLIFEMAGKDRQQVKLSGYDFNTNILHEGEVVWSDKSLPTDTFWFKIDDHGEFYVGTFLFPSEY